MFQINWKTKSLFYKIFGFLKLKIFFYIIQKLVTKRYKLDQMNEACSDLKSGKIFGRAIIDL